MSPDARAICAAILRAAVPTSTPYPLERVVQDVGALETFLAALPPSDAPPLGTAGKPSGVPKAVVHGWLDRIERWLEIDPASPMDDDARYSTIAATLANVRADLREFGAPR